MALLRNFCVGRHELNPQNSSLFLRFKSDVRLELAQNPSFVDGHYGLFSICMNIDRLYGALLMLYDHTRPTSLRGCWSKMRCGLKRERSKLSGCEVITSDKYLPTAGAC